MTTAMTPNWTLFLAAFRIGLKAQAMIEQPSVTSEDASEIARELLIDRIENGFTVSETGEHVKLPRFARARAKHLVQFGGWE